MIFIYYYLRYEIQLHVLTRTRRINTYNKLRHEFHAYISYINEDEDSRQWVTKELYVYLNNLEYNMCIPCKDFPAGGARFDQINEHISKSKWFIVILSEKYLKSVDQITEWNKIWNTFKSDKTTNIIVVNFDLLKSRNVEDRRLKAFVRLGYDMPFSNLNKTLLKHIAENLGPPTDDDSVRDTGVL